METADENGNQYLNEIKKYLIEKKIRKRSGSADFLAEVFEKEIEEDLAHALFYRSRDSPPKVRLISNESGEADPNEDLEQRVAKLENENMKLKNRIMHLNEIFEQQMKEILEKLDIISSQNVEWAFQALGFKPITKEVLKEYDDKNITNCKEIIIKEIRETDGNTDASTISEKYNLPLQLVAGCFDSLLKEKKIGEISD
ncbi:MAG: hypothetical protein AAE986_00790 [Thermoplasmataceae archaeon]|jgi:copper chaperone CopZ